MCVFRVLWLGYTPGVECPIPPPLDWFTWSLSGQASSVKIEEPENSHRASGCVDNVSVMRVARDRLAASVFPLLACILRFDF